MVTRWRVRTARPEDVVVIDAMVRELAAYEREPDAVTATVEDFRAALFGPDPRVHAHVAEVAVIAEPAGQAEQTASRDEPGRDATAAAHDRDPGWQVAGMAVWYVTFSTWRGRHGIWLEDLFVRPEHRGLGIGRGLLQALAAECVERGLPRLEWWVLDWNTPAHGFYRSLGASPQDEWTVWRLDGAALADLPD